MHRRIAMILTIAWNVPALAQGTQPEIQVPPEPPAFGTAPKAAPAPAPPGGAPGAAPLTVTGEAPPAAATTQAPATPPGAAPNEILIEPEGPHAERGEGHRVRLPPPGPGREAFLREFIRVDPRANAPFLGTEFLSAKEFYGRIGRPDLVARSDAQTRKRIWLMSAATLVTAAGVGAGAVVFGNVQSLNDPACFTNGTLSYNDCVDRANHTRLIGGLLIAAGVVVGGGILTWGLLTPEMVTPSEETVRLATEYNRNLAIRHGAPAGARLQILPSFGLKGASLSARLTF